MSYKNNRSVFDKSARSFQSWNMTTAECYMNGLNCDKCLSKKNCQIEAIYKNPYNIPNIKYAVLMTYSNIGTKGIDIYFTKLEKN